MFASFWDVCEIVYHDCIYFSVMIVIITIVHILIIYSSFASVVLKCSKTYVFGDVYVTLCMQ